MNVKGFNLDIKQRELKSHYPEQRINLYSIPTLSFLEAWKSNHRELVKFLVLLSKMPPFHSKPEKKE